MGTRPGTYLGENCISTTWVCHLGMARSIHTEETGKGIGPHQPQPAHQVTKVDVVQILQPSTTDMLYICSAHLKVSTWQCRAKSRTLFSPRYRSLDRERAPSSSCAGQGWRVLYYMLIREPSSRLKVCASLCRLFSHGDSRLWTAGSSVPRQKTQPSKPKVPQPFNTAKVPKKTHRVVAQRPTELDVMHSSMDRGKTVKSLGQLCCSQVGTRPRGAIQGH